MIGVIVWSSAAKLKAVIWCEDQGALAYLQGADNLINSHEWLQAGDMVELETEVRNELRHAFNVRIVTERKFSELPDMLRNGGTRTEPSPPALRVVASQEQPIRSPDKRSNAPELLALSAAGRKRF